MFYQQLINCLFNLSFYLWTGIFTKAGVKPNIIPEEAELYYYLRAPTKAELNDLIQRVVACIDGAAKMTGCEVS